MKKILSLLVLLQILLFAQAQTLTQTVKGTLIDKVSEKPLSGATVNVDGTSLSALTDANGRWSIAAVPLGRIKLTISFVGYATASIPEVR